MITLEYNFFMVEITVNEVRKQSGEMSFQFWQQKGAISLMYTRLLLYIDKESSQSLNGKWRTISEQPWKETQTTVKYEKYSPLL